jgi:SAM-dependent methyltransferase
MNSDKWDARYEEKELIWTAEPNMFLPPIVAGLEVGTALDLACGEGRNSIWLAGAGWDVTGVDFSVVAIDKAKKMAGDISVDWQVADVTTYKPRRAFDLVIIVYVHLDTDAMKALFDSAARALAPGGTLVAVGHALRNLTDGVGGPAYPDILWTEEKIAALVGDLDKMSLGEVMRPVDESDVEAIDLLVHATKPV